MPSVLITTNVFVVLAQSEVRSLGRAFLPLVVVQHPVGGLQPDEVRERMRPLRGEAVEGLVWPLERLAERYTGKSVVRFRPPRSRIGRGSS